MSVCVSACVQWQISSPSFSIRFHSPPSMSASAAAVDSASPPRSGAPCSHKRPRHSYNANSSEEKEKELDTDQSPRVLLPTLFADATPDEIATAAVAASIAEAGGESNMAALLIMKAKYSALIQHNDDLTARCRKAEREYEHQCKLHDEFIEEGEAIVKKMQQRTRLAQVDQRSASQSS